jgi:hypothetical protein
MTIKTETWIGWIAGITVVLITGTFVVITFAFAQFETKEHSNERWEMVSEQLKRINDKLDHMGPSR